MQIYLINLDRSAERLQLFVEQCDALGLTFQRVPAVDGESITPEELDSHLDPHAAPLLNAAQVGCFLSHRRAWAAIRDSGDRWGIVFEDDVKISPEFPEIVGRRDWIPEGADIVKLESWPKTRLRVAMRSVAAAGRRIHRLRGLSLGAAAYAISRDTCERLLRDSDQFARPLDTYLFDPQSPVFGQLATYVMFPAPGIQYRFLYEVTERPAFALSQISSGRRIDLRLSTREKLERELKRLGGQLKALVTFRRRIDWR